MKEKIISGLKEAGKDKVKMAITLIIVLTLCFLVITGEEVPDAFLIIATTVVTYYFCKDERKVDHEKDIH